MNPVALPCRREDLGYCRLETLVGVGDDPLDPGRSKPAQSIEKRQPERLGLRRTAPQAQDLPPTITVDPAGDGCLPSTLPDPIAEPSGRSSPTTVRPLALERPVQKRLDPPFDALAQTGHLALGDPLHPQGLHHVVHSPRVHPAYPGFLDHCRQGLRRYVAWGSTCPTAPTGS